jgi:hypothetical protein
MEKRMEFLAEYEQFIPWIIVFLFFWFCWRQNNKSLRCADAERLRPALTTGNLATLSQHLPTDQRNADAGWEALRNTLPDPRFEVGTGYYAVLQHNTERLEGEPKDTVAHIVSRYERILVASRNTEVSVVQLTPETARGTQKAPLCPPPTRTGEWNGRSDVCTLAVHKPIYNVDGRSSYHQDLFLWFVIHCIDADMNWELCATRTSYGYANATVPREVLAERDAQFLTDIVMRAWQDAILQGNLPLAAQQTGLISPDEVEELLRKQSESWRAL